MLAPPDHGGTKRKISNEHEDKRFARKINYSDSPSQVNPSPNQFSTLKMEDQIEILANSLKDLNQALIFIKLFNVASLPERETMQNTEACANLSLLKGLIEQLFYFQQNPTITSQEFQTEGFCLLALLARNATACNIIKKLSGLQLAISQLQTESSGTKLFSFCCYALGNFCSSLPESEAPEFFTLIEKEAIIPMLLTHLQKNIHDWDLGQQICFALGNIIYVADFEQSVLNSNGIQIVLESMMKHIATVCTRDAIFFLKNLSFGDAGRRCLIANFAVEKVIYSLTCHINDEDFVEFSLAVLYDLTFSGAASLLVNELTLEILFKSILQHRKSDAVTRLATRLLQRLYSESNQNGKVTLLESKLIHTIQCLDLPLSRTKTIYSTISESRFSHSIVPSDPVPSLQELIARKMFCDTFIENLQVPQDLQLYLSSPKGNCLCCGGVFYQHFFKKLVWTKLKESKKMLPVILWACSVDCFKTLDDHR